MKSRLLVVGWLVTVTAVLGAADVLEHHAASSRIGLYTDAQLTRAAAATVRRDPSFAAQLPGPTYAQPLYVENGPGGVPAFIVATEQDIVAAFAAADGSPLWRVSVGTPVPLSALPCGNIDPLGITGTPVIDPAARTIYLDAMTTPDGGATKQHLIFALSLDDGSVEPGWPVAVDGLTASGNTFASSTQNQRGALVLSNGSVYVPFGGHFGDCGSYNGWVVAVPVNDPTSPAAWSTAANGGGIWAPGGLASDGTSVFAATGNTSGATDWSGGEAIVRLGSGATFSGATADYFAPSNWQSLDDGDLDIGGSGPLLVDVPGASPSALVVALGKNGVAYLLDRGNLGGIGTGDGSSGEGLFSARVATGSIRNAAAAYTTASATYVVFNAVGGAGIGCPGQPGDLVALQIAPTSPPTMQVAWCAASQGRGSPIVSTTDGSSDAVVWIVGAEGTNRLYGYDGDTGATVFDGGTADDGLSFVRRFMPPIVAAGRIIIAADTELDAFTVQPPATTAAVRPR